MQYFRNNIDTRYGSPRITSRKSCACYFHATQQSLPCVFSQLFTVVPVITTAFTSMRAVHYADLVKTLTLVKVLEMQ